MSMKIIFGVKLRLPQSNSNWIRLTEGMKLRCISLMSDCQCPNVNPSYISIKAVLGLRIYVGFLIRICVG